MGSFNQVCLLTRAPITSGDEIMVWEEIVGPWANIRNAGRDPGLMFGVPQRASYNDYGGAENYVDEELFAFHENAWEAQTLYRSHKVNNSYETKMLYIAANPETMSKTHELAPFFYGQEELDPLAVFVDDYDDIVMQKKGRAQAKAATVLKNIGERIGKAVLPKDEAGALAACFNIVQQEVGPNLAWAVWETISKGELFARRELCMMRAEAYDYLVSTVGQNTVSKYLVPNSKMTYRDSLKKRWSEWDEKRQSNTTTNALLSTMLLREERLMPMARPWGLEDKPIESFFWNAVSYDSLVESVGKEHFLDALVFSTAWNNLQSPLRAEHGGGQHADWKLHADMMKAVHKKARTEGPLKRDWYPYN